MSQRSFVLSLTLLTASPLVLNAQVDAAHLQAQRHAAMMQAQADAARLQASLIKLDAASAKFANAQAVFRKDQLTKLVGDHDLQNGTVYFVRTGGGTLAGIRLQDKGDAKKATRIVEYKNGILRDLVVASGCYNTVDSSANKAKADSFLTLGFGSSGKDLSRAWDIVDQGPETVGGVKAEKLEMVSKDQGLRNTYSKVTLWMDLDRGVSVKQFLLSPSGDTTTAEYTGIVLNAKKVDTKPFEIKGNACH